MGFVERVVANKNRTLSIRGVPGSGKTQFACDYAAAISPMRVLYLSFGKQNTKAAMRRLGANVVCKSFHAFAKQQMGINTSRITSKVTMGKLKTSLAQMGLDPLPAKLLEALVAAIEVFAIGPHTFTHLHGLFSVKGHFPILDRDEKQAVMKALRLYWVKLWEPGAHHPITHDMYLKAYALIGGEVPFDKIIADEAQDLNDAMFMMLDTIGDRTPRAQTLLLGDPCQQIFGFRGASQRFLANQFDYTLNHTHRFGRKIVSLVNHFMQHQYLPYFAEITSEHDNSSIGQAPPLSRLIDETKQGARYTVIMRYNMTLWHILKELAQAGIRCHVLGGIQQHELDFLAALHQAYIGRRVTRGPHQGLSFVSYKQESKLYNDRAGMLACQFVESLKGDPDMIFNMMRQHITDAKRSDILLANVHQSKGLQFNNVILGHDFPKAIEPHSLTPVKMAREEAHLLYTAMTRTRSQLYLPRDMYRYWEKRVSGEREAQF